MSFLSQYVKLFLQFLPFQFVMLLIFSKQRLSVLHICLLLHALMKNKHQVWSGMCLWFLFRELHRNFKTYFQLQLSESAVLKKKTDLFCFFFFHHSAEVCPDYQPPQTLSPYRMEHLSPSLLPHMGLITRWDSP